MVVPSKSSKQLSTQRPAPRQAYAKKWFYTLFLLPLTTTIALPLILWRYHHAWHDSRDEHLTLFETTHRPKLVLHERIVTHNEPLPARQRSAAIPLNLLHSAKHNIPGDTKAPKPSTRVPNTHRCPASSQEFNVWLYTVIDCDTPGSPALVPHWFKHYTEWRFKPDKFLIVLHQGINATYAEGNCEPIKQFLSAHNLNYTAWNGPFTSDQHLKMQLELMRSYVTEMHDWVVMSSLTELHEYGDQWWSIQHFLKTVAKTGATWVKGRVVERLPRNSNSNSRLPSVAAQPSLFQQFPQACDFGGVMPDSRWHAVAFTAFLRVDAGARSVLDGHQAQHYFGRPSGGQPNTRGAIGAALDLYSLTPYHFFPDCYASGPRHRGVVQPPWEVKEYNVTVSVHDFRWHHGLPGAINARLDVYKDAPEAGKGNVEYEENIQLRDMLDREGAEKWEGVQCIIDEHAHNTHAHKRAQRRYIENIKR